MRASLRPEATQRARSPRVLHILNELRPSGAEVMLRAAAALWWTAGERPHAILATAATEGPYACRLRAAGFEVLHISFRKRLGYFVSVYSLIRKGGFDAVHIHTEQANFLYAVVARLAGVRRIVHTIHAAFPFTGALRLVRALMRVGLRALRVSEVSVGPSVAENEAKRFHNRTVVIRNWYDDKVFRPPTEAERAAARRACGFPEGVPILTSLGNCHPWKNHALILRALPLLLQMGPDWLYVHAGGEDAEQSERRLAAELHVEGGCRFLGYTDDPRLLLWASDVFVMTSLQEGQGMAAVEAAACGLPLVLTDVPGLRDLKTMIHHGLWVDVDPATLAAAVASAHREWSGTSMQNGDAARKAFGAEAGAGAYGALYAGLPSATTERGHTPL